MSRPPPQQSDLRIPLSGRQMVRRQPKTALTPRRGQKSPIFDASTVEAEADSFDFVNPGAGEGDQLLSARNPGLLAMRRKAESSRPATTLVTTRDKKQQKREVEIVSPRNFTSLLAKRPSTAMKESSRKVPETIMKEINTEKLSLCFDEDPVAYFSKRKDGRGHRFIYLNRVGDRKIDPFFNPYDLEKVAFADVNPEYFTMSANGVTRVMVNGNTEHIPIDRWANETALFATVRKLKMFAQFFYWKPFRIWKKFVMRQRFGELSTAIVAHPFFMHQGFYATQLTIVGIHVEDDNSLIRVEEMIQKYLLAFLPQAKFSIQTFHAEIDTKTEVLNKVYNAYVIDIQSEVLKLDARIRDPKILQVRDADFPEIKRRNPNLGQLMMLERKKAERRVELTKKVNDQILTLGYFIRDVDYMLLEALTSAVYSAWRQAESYVAQDMSAVFQVEVSYNDDGTVKLTPELPDLLTTIRKAMADAIKTVSNLPRLLNAQPLRAHIRESHPNFASLVEDGPKLRQMVKKDNELAEIEERICEIVSSSYQDAVVASKAFATFFPVYELGRSWKVESYIKTRDGRPVNMHLGGDDKDKDAEDEGLDAIRDFDNEPVVDMGRVRDDIELFKRDDRRLQQFRPTTSRGALYINSKAIRSHLSPIPLATLNTLSKTLKKLLMDKVDRIRNALTYYGRQLKVEPSKLDQFVAFCELITHTSGLTPTINQEIDFIDDLYRLFDDFHLNMSATEQNENSLPPHMHVFLTSQQGAVQTKEANMNKFTVQLKDLTKRLENKLQKYLEMAASQPSSVEEAEPEKLKTDVEHIKEKVNKICPDIDECKRYQRVMSVDYCQFTGYGDVVDTLEFVEKLYGDVELWHEVERTAMKVPFHTVDVDTFIDSISSLKSRTETLTSSTRVPTALLIELASKVEAVYPYLDQIRFLAQAKMQARHWQALFETAELPNAYHPDIRLEELIHLGILSHRESIQEQSSVALGESQLEGEFQEVQTRWSSVQLPLMDGQTKSEDSMLLDKVGPMIGELEHSIMDLTRMSAMPFVHGVREQIVKLQASLESAALILDVWQLFQRHWVMCCALFSYEDSRNSLQTQAGRFTWVRRRWVTIVRHSLKDLSLLSVCALANILEMMKDNNSALEGILSALGTYMDAKRASIPRLFTLGNADVLTLIAACDIPALCRVVPRLFMKMHGVDKADVEMSAGTVTQRLKIMGLVGEDGDAVTLERPVTLSGGVEHWLPSLVDGVKHVFVDGVSATIPKVKGVALGDWILTTLSHVSLVALNLSFCAEVDECFDQLEANVHAFSNYENSLRKMHGELVGLLDSPLAPVEVAKVSAALALVGNELEILRHIGGDRDQRFWWSQMPRLVYSSETQRLLLHSDGGQMDFGWEIWGRVRPFIMTPSMTRVFHNLSVRKSAILTGSSSCDRSDVVEYLATIGGRFLYHALPFRDFEYVYVARIVAGTCAMGAWAVFDDVEKLPFQAVSHLNDCVNSFLDGMLLNAPRISLNNRSIELNPATRILFTASEIPDKIIPQLRSRVRSIGLSAPERRFIVEAKLLVWGFRSAKTLAKKLDAVVPVIVNTFANALQSNSVLVHMNRIIDTAGELTRETKDSNFTRKFGTIQEIEEFIAARTIYYHFIGALDKMCHEAIVGIIYNSFRLYERMTGLLTAIEMPGCFREEMEIDALAMECQKVIKGATPKELVDKTLCLFNILRSRRCAIVHGPPNAGKSTVLRVLETASAAVLSDERTVNKYKIVKRVKVERVFHVSDTWERTFGEYVTDPLTGSVWMHGMVSAAIHSLLDAGPDVTKILVFDGPISPQFQTFIATMIHSDHSCINSLDTIDFGNNFRILIETDTLRGLSPDLIRNCGLLSMDHLQKTLASPCEFSQAQVILARVFGGSEHPNVLVVFDEVLQVVVKYMYHRDNYVCYSDNPKSLQDGSLIITDQIPTHVAHILRAMMESDDIDSSDKDRLTLATCYACFIGFSPILPPSQVPGFDSWLRSSFHISMGVDWSDVGVPVHFSSVFAKPCLQSHRIVKGDLEPLDLSLLDGDPIMLHESRLFLDGIIVPHAYFPGMTHALEMYLRRGRNVMLSGESGKSAFLKHFFASNERYTPVFLPTSATKSSDSLFRFIGVHTNLTQKFAVNQKRTIIVLQDISAENVEIVEFMRQILSEGYVPRSSVHDPTYYAKVMLKNVSFIVTTRDFSTLPLRFVFSFALLTCPAISQEIIRYTTEKIMNAMEVEKKAAREISDFIDLCMHQIAGFPKTLPFAVKIISSICRMKERQCANADEKMLIIKTMLVEINALLLRHDPERVKAMTEIACERFRNDKCNEVLLEPDSLFYPEFSVGSNDGLLSVTCASHKIDHVKEELEFYLQVYNNAATEKIVMKFTPKVMRYWLMLHRAITAPGGTALLVGAHGTGRFTLTRFVAHMSEYDFVHVSGSEAAGEGSPIENLHAVMRDVVTNCALMHKKGIIFVRHSGHTISRELQSVLDFAKTRDFTPFFSRVALEDLYHKFSNGQAIRVEQRLDLFGRVQTALRANFRVVVAADSGSCPINLVGTVPIEFTPYTATDYLELAENSLASPIYQNILGNYKTHMSKVLRNIHNVVAEAVGIVHVNHYHDFVDLFATTVNMDYQDLVTRAGNLLSVAIRFMVQLEEESQRVDRQMDQMSPSLHTLTKECEALEMMFTTKKETIASRKAQMEKDLAERTKAVSQAQSCVDQLQTEITGILPIVAKAQARMEQMQLNEIETIRINAESPNPALKVMLEVLCIFVGYPISYDRGGRKLLMDNDIVQILTNKIHYQSVTHATTQQILPYFDNPDFSKDGMETVAPALEDMYHWIVTIYKYSVATESMQYKLIELEECKSAYTATVEESKLERSSMEQVELSIEDEIKRLNATNASKSTAEASFAAFSARRKSIDVICKDMDGLVERWREESASVSAQRESVIGDALFYACYIAYCGLVSGLARASLIASVIGEIKSNGFTMSFENPIEFLNDRFVKIDYAEGSFANEHSYVHESFTDLSHMKVSLRVPLLVDPDGLLEFYLTKCKKAKAMVVVSQNSRTLDSVIATAMTEGKTLLVFDVDDLHPYIAPVLSLMRLSDKKNVSKDVRIGTKITTWDPEFRMVLFSTHRDMRDVPARLRARVTPIDVSESSVTAIRSILNLTFVEFFDSSKLPRLVELQRMSLDCRVGLQSHERDILETISDAVTTQQKNPEFDILTDDETMRDLAQSKELYFRSVERMETFENSAADIAKFTRPYIPIVEHVMNVWRAISRYAVRLSDMHQFSYAAFVSVVSNALHAPGVVKGQMNIDQQHQLQNLITQHVMNWIMPGLTFKESIVCMFMICFLQDVSKKACKISDLDVIVRHLVSEATASFDVGTSEVGIGDALEHLKFTNVRNVMTHVSRYIAETFSTDFANNIPFFQVENIISASASIPTLLISSKGVNPTRLISTFIAQKTRGDNFESYSVVDDPEQLRNLQKIVSTAMSRGTRILLHVPKPTKRISAMLSDIYDTIVGTSMHMNFRLIISCSSSGLLSHRLVVAARRLCFDSFPSVRHQMLQIYHHHSAVIKSASNPKAIKKIAYAAALCFSLLHYRGLLVPHGFNSSFDVPNMLFMDFMETIRPVVDNAGRVVPLKAIRDYLQDTIIGATVVDQFDRRRIRALIYSIFGPDLLNENFNYCNDFADSDRWVIPHDIPLASVTNTCQKLPSFPQTDCLLMRRNCCGSVKDWNLSKWIIEGISKLVPVIVPTQDQATLATRQDGYLMSVPRRIGTRVFSKRTSPMMTVLRAEVEQFNALLEEMRSGFSASTVSADVRQFVSGTVPGKWRDSVMFDGSMLSARFIPFLNEKREFLMKCVSAGTVDIVDVRLFCNLNGLLHAFLVERAAQREFNTDTTSISFSLVEPDGVVPQDALVLRGISVISGSVDNMKGLIINERTTAIESFPDLCCTITTAAVKTSHIFDCPLFRSLWLDKETSRSSLRSFTDGQSSNLIWHVPIATGNTQVDLTSNGTCLVCHLPEQFSG